MSPSTATLTLQLALAAGVSLHALAAAAQAPARRAAPATVVAALAPTTQAADVGAPSCSEVGEDPQLYHVAVGKTARYKPKLPVARMVLDDQASGSGIPGATDPGAAQGAAPAGGSSSGANVSMTTTRPRANSQSVGARPGVGDVSVRLLSPTDVYITGKSIGASNVVMLHAGGACTFLNVVVGMDTTGLQNAIDTLLKDEQALVRAEERVTVTAAFDSLVLKGTVSETEALTRVTDLANAYLRGGETNGNSGAAAGNPRIVNMLSVGAPQQVMLEVKVAEVSKRLLDQFGIDFSRAYVPGDGSVMRFLAGVFGGSVGLVGQISGTGPNGVPFSSVDAVVGGTVPVPGIEGGNVTRTPQGYETTFGTVPGRGVTNGVLNMQKTDGLVRVLAEPTVMAISGQTGSFLACGTIFIPVAQSAGAGVGVGNAVVTLEEKDFGISVKFTPTVLGNGRINLKVRNEVSEINPSGVSLRGLSGSAILPSLISRKAETTVQLMDGQSFAIGGLIKNNNITSIKAFPFLGELPVIGALFRSTEFQTDRSELVFVITPHLVKPLPANYRLPTDNYVPPTRQELIWEGRTEGRAPADPAAAPVAAPAVTLPAADGAATVPAAPAGGGFDTQTPEKK